MAVDVVQWLRTRQEQSARLAPRVSGEGEAAEIYGKAADEITRLREALDAARSAFLAAERHCEASRAQLTSLSRRIDT